MNPAAMTERLIDAAIYNEEAQGGYVAGARKELSEARAAIEDTLSSQSLSLSEAREEIERLRSALLVVRPVVAGLIDAQYNVETWGLKGRLAKLDSELRRERVCEVCGGDCSAANPPPSYCPERDDFSALENGPAGLGGSSHG